MIINELKEVVFYSSDVDQKKLYAEYVVPGKGNTPDITKFSDIDSPEFKSYLRRVILPEMAEGTTVGDIIEYVKDECNIYGNDDETAVKVRTAGKLKDGLIEYALYNSANECIIITPEGYELSAASQHKFIKMSTSAKQVYPEKTDKTLFELMKPYVNASKDMLKLCCIWLVQTFCEGNHSAILIRADAGSGKSTTTKIIKKIIDPSNADASKVCKQGDNLLNALTNSYVLTLDNLRELTKDESDTLCIAVTGGTYSKREAYTTNECAIYPLHNILILNGISVLPSESDFAQRCLCLQLKGFPNNQGRKPDSEINDKFKKDLPKILHCIFITLARAMNIINDMDLNFERQPRMLDAYVEMLAIAIAMGMAKEEFDKIYFDNIDFFNKLRANDDLVYAVREYMEKIQARSYEDMVSKVYAAIRNNYSGNKSALPGSASQFSYKLKTEYHSLLAAGFTVNIDDTHADGTHIKIIKNK